MTHNKNGGMCMGFDYDFVSPVSLFFLFSLKNWNDKRMKILPESPNSIVGGNQTAKTMHKSQLYLQPNQINHITNNTSEAELKLE